jgi:CRP/FNR family transcriptional regulator
VVSGFFLPGDVVGVDALGVKQYPNDAIAVADGEVCRLDFQLLLAACANKPGMSDWVISRIGLYVRQKDHHLCWAMGMHSQQRILHFFLDLYDRLPPAPDRGPAATTLPMQKQDIAHYLHMTPETLSRNLATLRQRGLLLLQQDGFVLPDPTRARRAAQG